MASDHPLHVRADPSGNGRVRIHFQEALRGGTDVAVLKSHQFWIGIIVGLILVGFFPMLNVVGKLKSGPPKAQ
jgi:hypothetical protein